MAGPSRPPHMPPPVRHEVLFAAEVLEGPRYVSAGYRWAPTRVRGREAVKVRNPFTGHALWLSPRVVSPATRVGGRMVVAVHMPARYSGRAWGLNVRAGRAELINPFTGNTFQVSHSAIKETA